MSDGPDASDPSVAGATRRSVLASLGSGDGFESSGAAGGTTDGRGDAVDTDDGPSRAISNASWILEHAGSMREADIGGRRRHYDTTHSLAYLGAQWTDYGNPNPGTGPSGAWKHTFVLGARTVEVVEEPEASDGTKMDVDRTGAISHGDGVKKGYVEVDVAEELNRSGGDSEPETRRENVAVSLRRDGDLFHFLGPGAFVELLDTEATVECKEPCDPGVPGEIPGCADNCRESYAGETTVGELLTGTGEHRRATFDEYQEAIAVAEERQQRQSRQNAVFDLSKLGLSIVASRLVCSLGSLVCFGVLTGAELLSWAVPDEEEEPETTFERGFHKEYDPLERSSFPRTGLGHTMMFDVYVTPDEEKTGTVTVKSQHDKSLLHHEPLERHLDFEEIRERARVVGFNPLPQWELEFPGAPPPTGSDRTYPSGREYQPKIVPPDADGSQTNVEVKFAGDREYNREPPAAEFSIDPEQPTPDEPVTFDATRSKEITEQRGQVVDEYRWLVWGVDRDTMSTELVLEPFEGREPTRDLDTGLYAVQLTVVTESGLHDAKRQLFTVKARSAEEAVRGDDGILESEDLIEARDRWAADEAVPGTGGERLDSETLQELTTEYSERWGLFQTETEWGVRE